ncbi:MAG: hypothetical protein HPAVJP_2800 [Candidatus Hepatoplasma vulgare]|nr:MAG: hypothetical protein HPAVJP_2800 [Candidatus Hepatoplasma sp.]
MIIVKIVITGTTGVGKSTTVKGLDDYFLKKNKKVKPSKELVVDSPFFDLYFEDLKEWGFLSQLDFLLTRFRQYVNNEISQKKDKSKKDIIYLFDRHFLEDKIFAELKIIKESISAKNSDMYLYVYNQILERLDEDFTKIDYIILLKANFEEIINRMRKRGREIEEKFSREYWFDLYNGYYNNEENLNLFRKYSKHLLIIDTTNLNPDEVLKTIIEKIKSNKG